MVEQQTTRLWMVNMLNKSTEFSRSLIAPIKKGIHNCDTFCAELAVTDARKVENEGLRMWPDRF